MAMRRTSWGNTMMRRFFMTLWHRCGRVLSSVGGKMRRSAILGALLLIFGGTACGQWSEPVLVDSPDDTLGINTASKEWCPYITADCQTLYYSRSGMGDIYVSHRTETGWTDGVKLPFCLPNVDERNPSVNATDDTLYFISWTGTWDIFWVFRTGPCDTCWGEPERLPEPINSNGIEFSVWCTPDNQRLLFSSWRISANGEDIYECRRDASTPTGWSEPHLMAGVLNTWDRETYPSMGFDTTEIFFYGRYARIYRAVLTDSGWTRGDSLPDHINRGYSEETPCITPDGRRLYFKSRWSQSGAVAGDIWYTDRSLNVPVRTSGREQGFRLEVYPNPAHEKLTIRLPVGVQRLRLFDVLGRMVAERHHTGSSGTLLWDLEQTSLPSGTYYLEAQTGTVMETIPLYILK